MNADGIAETSDDTGPIGPVAVSALLLLIAVSPLMRGGNRQVALIAIESVALAFLVALFGTGARWKTRWSVSEFLFAAIFLSPLWLAVVYLLPLPAAVWTSLPGRAIYAQLLPPAGIAMPDWLPLSPAPAATAASLLAGIPLMAAFLAGHLLRLRQLRRVAAAAVLMALVQIVFGMLQIGGGRDSGLNFGLPPGRPYGTFANPNHYANYIAMALAVYIWLAWAALSESRRPGAPSHSQRRGARGLAPWIAGAVLLMVGLLMSQSRGAILTGLPAAILAAVVAWMLGTGSHSWRTSALLVSVAVGTGIALVGLDVLVTRFDVGRLANDVPFRAIQATSTLQGAAEFWPLGAGWGTYHAVYPRFQPPNLVGTADYAHHDYAQMLFEGGIFAVLLMAAFGWLAVTRAIVLVKAARRRRRLHREEMAAAICGIGLLGFLLHSFVEFNMHIPANAIVAALLAGVFLRPLDREEREPQGREGGDD